MSTKPQELNKVIADLRQIIVGKVAMPTDQIEQITLFLFLKQLSRKHDDLVRIGSKELIFTGAWERYHFDVLMRHSGEELVKECREAVESLYKNPHIDATVRKVFERSYLKILEPKVLSSFLQYLNDKFSDGLDLGDFYESLLPILGTQNELGQFRTPRHIIDFIVRVVDPNIGEKIADPACGTAGFLVSAFNYLKEKYTDEKGRLKLNPEQTKKLYNETIFGWDMEPLMVKFSLANLYLHGLKVPNVSENDTLLNENLWQHTFDIILANPPFITPKGGARRHSRFAITSNKTEVLFCEYMVHHLNFNGRMGVIVPEGIIFDASKGHQAIRKLFLDNGLWCVVSLPAQVFQPYSGVKTSIIFLDKTLQPENILFYKIENHGFSLNTNPGPIEKNDLPEALEVIKKYKNNLQENKQNELEGLKFYTVAKSKILENDLLSLNSGIYLEKIKLANHKWPIVKLESVCKIKTGKKDVNQGNPNGKYPFFTCAKDHTYSDEYSFDTEALLIAGNGDVGAINYYKGKFEAYQRTYVLSDFENVIAKYLFYILDNSLKKVVSGQKQGNTMPYIKLGMLQNFELPLPPLEIQEQIVAELETYQKVIDGAQAVVENWKPSFEIDPKWELKILGEICDVRDGTHDSPKYVQNGVPLITSKNLVGGKIDFENVNYISQKDHDQISKRSGVDNGDVLFAMIGTIGNPVVVKKDFEFSIKNVALFKMKDNKCLNNLYLRYLLDSVYAQENLLSTQRGIAQKFVALKDLRNFNIPVPPLEIQKQIVAKIEEEQKIVEANKKLIDLFQQKIEAKIKSIYG
jgi:type I restriction enzyme M protein